RSDLFRALFDGRNTSFPGERPTLSDWANHLSTIFPEVRLKRYLEMRAPDGCPWGRLRPRPAWWALGLYGKCAGRTACRGDGCRRFRRSGSDCSMTTLVSMPPGTW